MTDLQTVVLGILKFVDEVCRENGLTYYLAYGTLLGAVRHHGFIPWDDDIDLWMPREDYMKLLEILQNTQDERYALSTGDLKPNGDRPEVLQMRIVDKKVRIKRAYAVGEVIPYFPWVDIFALDEYPKKNFKKYISSFKRELFMFKVARSKTFLIKAKSFYGMMNRFLYFLYNKCGLLKHCLNEQKHLDKVYKAITRYSQNKEENDGVFCYAAVYLSRIEKCLFETEWFGKPVELEFEGLRCLCPRNTDSILKKVYGDYMQLPPEDQRRKTHDVELVVE